MEKLLEYWPFLMPYFGVVLVLAISALVHLSKQSRVRFGTKGMWVLIILLIQIIGPVLYFTIGRGDEA